MRLLRRGSVKEVYEVEGLEELEFRFTDRISVFDKPIETAVPHKGEVLCRLGAYWFGVAADLGVRTHFIRRASSNAMRVKRVQVIKDCALLSPASRNYLIPIEFVTRYFVAGTLSDRLKEGKVKPEELGFQSGSSPSYGARLPTPYFETGTKFEKYDRFIGEEETMRISGLDHERVLAIREVALTLDGEVATRVNSRGLIHVDGKKEFAVDKDGLLMLVDVFGTPDEDRFWDASEYSKGRCDELSKEYVRQYYRQIGYKDELYSARSRGEPEPAIPALPHHVVKNVSELYIQLFERITGERF